MAFSSKNLRNIDIEKLNHFYLVYRAKSINEASKKYSINNQILRHSLNTIEKKLFTKLYYSNIKKFLPTPDGINLYRICEDIINSLKTYDSKLFEDDKNVIKYRELIIVTTTTLAHYFLPSSIIQTLEKEHHLTIKIYSGPEYIENSDFGFDILISPSINHPNLIQKRLIKFEYSLYCSKNYKNRLGKLSSPSDLKNQNMLLFAGKHLLNEDLVKNNYIKIVSNSYPLLVKMCLEDQGILSCFNIKNLNTISDNIDIVPVIEDYITEKETVYFYFNRLNDKIALIEEFYQIICNELQYYGGANNEQN